MRYEEEGEEKWDPIEDDTAIVANVKNKGLVILSGCAHSGIINTVEYARKLTGVERLFVVMGGFHLTGADLEPVIGPTTDALKALNPQYIVPAHCTGRKAGIDDGGLMPEQIRDRLRLGPGSHDEGDAGTRYPGHGHGRLGVFFQSLVMDISHNADHFQSRPAEPLGHDPLAQGAFVRPYLRRRILVDENRPRRIGEVSFVEIAPQHERHTHGLEVIRADKA